MISNTARFAEGTATGANGVITKEDLKKHEGWYDSKGASVNAAIGIVGGVVYTGKSLGQRVNGVIRKDREQWTNGLKNIGKATAVITLGVGLVDILDAKLQKL